MLAKTIIDSDAFLDMPQSTQLLYFHLSIRADDDGFINNPKSIMRNIGCKEDDVKLLIAKKFLIPFDSGVVVIKHWKIHNYIQKDRYRETKYLDEKRSLQLDENNVYQQANEPCIQGGYNLDTQVRLGKDRVELSKDKVEIGEDRVALGEYEGISGELPSASRTSSAPKMNHFVQPAVEEIERYCTERTNSVDPQRFYDYYESNGWRVGKNPMKDWKATVRTWENNGYSNAGSRGQGNQFLAYVEDAF